MQIQGIIVPHARLCVGEAWCFCCMGRSFTSNLADKLQVELPPNDGCCCSKDLLRIRREVRQRNYIKVSTADVNSQKTAHKRCALSSSSMYNTHCTQEYACTQSCAHNYVHTIMCACRGCMRFLWRCRALTAGTTSCRTCCVRAAPRSCTTNSRRIISSCTARRRNRRRRRRRRRRPALPPGDASDAFPSGSTKMMRLKLGSSMTSS